MQADYKASTPSANEKGSPQVTCCPFPDNGVRFICKSSG